MGGTIDINPRITRSQGDGQASERFFPPLVFLTDGEQWIIRLNYIEQVTGLVAFNYQATHHLNPEFRWMQPPAPWSAWMEPSPANLAAVAPNQDLPLYVEVRFTRTDGVTARAQGGITLTDTGGGWPGIAEAWIDTGTGPLVKIAEYESVQGDGILEIAAALAASINAGPDGWEATVEGAFVRITAPVGSGAAANGWILSCVIPDPAYIGPEEFPPGFGSIVDPLGSLVAGADGVPPLTVIDLQALGFNYTYNEQAVTGYGRISKLNIYGDTKAAFLAIIRSWVYQVAGADHYEVEFKPREWQYSTIKPTIYLTDLEFMETTQPTICYHSRHAQITIGMKPVLGKTEFYEEQLSRLLNVFELRNHDDYTWTFAYKGVDYIGVTIGELGIIIDGTSGMRQMNDQQAGTWFHEFTVSFHLNLLNLAPELT